MHIEASGPIKYVVANHVKKEKQGCYKNMRTETCAHVTICSPGSWETVQNCTNKSWLCQSMQIHINHFLFTVTSEKPFLSWVGRSSHLSLRAFRTPPECQFDWYLHRIVLPWASAGYLSSPTENRSSTAQGPWQLMRTQKPGRKGWQTLISILLPLSLTGFRSSFNCPHKHWLSLLLSPSFLGSNHSWFLTVINSGCPPPPPPLFYFIFNFFLSFQQSLLGTFLCRESSNVNRKHLALFATAL